MAEPFETEIDIDAPAEEVFRHLTEPGAMLAWMGQHALLEPLPGGRFEIDVNGIPIRGQYLEVVASRRADGRAMRRINPVQLSRRWVLPVSGYRRGEGSVRVLFKGPAA